MSWPVAPAVTPPDAAAGDGYYIPSPDGYSVDRTYADACAACPQACKRLERVNYSVPGLSHVTSPWALGPSHAHLAAHYVLEAQRRLNLLRWIAEGQPAAYNDYQINGERTVNFSDRWTFRVVGYDAPNKRAVIYNQAGGYSDPRRMAYLGQFIPGQGFNTFYIALTPGMEAIDSRGTRTLITDVEFHQEVTYVQFRTRLSLAQFSDLTVWAEAGDPPHFDYLQPSRPLFVHRHTTDWFTADTPEWTPLRRRDGQLGRIAWPIKWSGQIEGTFRVWARSEGGDVSDITDQVLGATTGDAVYANFPGYAYDREGGGKAYLRIYRPLNGTWRTEINLFSFVTPNSVEFRVEYCPECPDQANPDADAWAPTQAACRHSQIDYTRTLGSFRANCPTSPRAKYVHVVSVMGESAPVSLHYYCSKMDCADVHPVGYEAWCYATECPYFELAVPWRPDADQLKRLWLARDVRLLQTNLGDPTPRYSIGRDDFPSLCYLLGMPSPTNHGLFLPQIWYGGGWFGYRPSPSADIRIEAIREGLTGTLQAGESWIDRPSPVGGIAGSRSLRLNTAHYETDAATPCRALGTIQTSQAQTAPQGRGEFAVQTVRRWRYSLEGLHLGAGLQTRDQATCEFAEFLVAGRSFGARLRIVALGGDSFVGAGRAFDRKPLSLSAESVVNSSMPTFGGRKYLYCEFAPEMVTFAGVPDPFVPRTVVEREVACCGGTVDPPNHQRPTNPSVGPDRARYGDTRGKWREGDTGKFIIPGHSGDVWLTAIYTKAFAGAVYTGPPAGGNPDQYPSGWLTWPGNTPGCPAFYANDAERLQMDVVIFEIGGGEDGLQGEDIVALLGPGGRLPVNTRVECYTASAMPPAAIYETDGQFHATGYAPTLEHVTRRGAEILSAETLLPNTDYRYDRATGWFAIANQIVAAWDRSQGVTHCLSVSGWFYDRSNTCPAEVWIGLREALGKSFWMHAGPSMTNAALAMVLQGAGPNGYTDAARLFWHYHAFGEPYRQHLAWPASYTNPTVALVPQGDLDNWQHCQGCRDTWGPDDDNWPFASCWVSGVRCYTGAGSQPAYALVPVGNVAIGATFHPPLPEEGMGIEYPLFACSYSAAYQAALFNRQGALLRLDPDDIAEATVDYRLSNCRFWHLDVDSDRPAGQQALSTEDQAGSLRIEIARFVTHPDQTVTVSHLGMGAVVAHLGDGWHRADITAPLQAMLADTGATGQYGFLIRGGYGAESLSGGSYNDLFYSWASDIVINYEGYEAGVGGYWPVGREGNPGHVSRIRGQSHRMSADSVEFANVAVRLSLGALARNVPVFHRGDRAGWIPALIAE